MNIPYTVNNIVQYADANPQQIIVDIDALVNNPTNRPEGVTERYSLELVSEKLSYFSNVNGYLLGLWGAMKLATNRSERDRMAIRDFLSEMAAASRNKYEAVSRVLSSYEMIRRDTQMGNRL